MTHRIFALSRQVPAIPSAKWPLSCAGAAFGMKTSGQQNSYVKYTSTFLCGHKHAKICFCLFPEFSDVMFFTTTTGFLLVLFISSFGFM